MAVVERSNNDTHTTEWWANQAKLEEFVWGSIKGEDGKLPTWKEIEMATGLSQSSIARHMKALDLKAVFERTKLLGPMVAMEQAMRALKTGDHNEAKTYFKLNYDWAEKTETKVSGSLEHTITGRRLADIPDEDIPATELGLAEGRLLLKGNEVFSNPAFTEVKSGESESEMPFGTRTETP